jgi:hypothetical protein
MTTQAPESFDAMADTPRPPTALDPVGGEDLRSAAEEAGAAIEQLYRVGSAYVAHEAQDRPYRVLGIAAGIGFVLGGGLAWRMAGRLMNVAGRIAVTRGFEEWAAAAAKKEQHS